jgi:hypothetical protein
MAFFHEVRRKPSQIKPPDRIGHHLAEQEGPRLSVTQKRCPRHAKRRLGRLVVALDQLALLARQPRMLLGRAVVTNPEEEPEEPREARDDEGGLPVPGQGDGHDGPRGQNDADVAAGVEDAGREGALALGEPFGDGLDARGEVGRLAETEREAGDRKPERAPREGMAHGGHAPDGDPPDHAEPDAELVEQATRDAEHDGVRKLEGEVDPAIARVVPADLFLQDGVQDAHRVAIEVVDRRREEEQRADVPAKVLDRAAGRGGLGHTAF